VIAARARVGAALAACALSAWLMVHGLGHRPLWFDETISVEAARLRFAEVIRYVGTHEGNMALYHALLHGWIATVGDGETTDRIPSVVSALATLPVVALLARRLFDARVAAISVVLVALDVPFVAHARESRSYTLALLLTTLAALCLVIAVEDRRRRSWLLYGVVAALSVYAHLFAALAIAGQVVSLVALRGVPWRRAWVAGLAGAVLLAPLGLSVVLSDQGGQIDWLEAPHLRQLPGLLLWLTGSHAVAVLFLAGLAAALVAAAREVARSARSDSTWRWALALGWLVVPPLAAFLISLEKPVYLYRYFLFSLPALAALFAAGFVSLGYRAAIVGTVAAAAFSVHTIVSCGADCPLRYDEWRAATAYVQAEARPGDAIMFDPAELRTAYAHYAAVDGPRLLYPDRWPLVGGPRVGVPSIRGITTRAPQYRRIWLVTWWLPSGAVAAALPPHWTRTRSRDFAGNVRVRLYVRPGSS
jgi:mannosyltransferase